MSSDDPITTDLQLASDILANGTIHCSPHLFPIMDRETVHQAYGDGILAITAADSHRAALLLQRLIGTITQLCEIETGLREDIAALQTTVSTLLAKTSSR